MVNGQAAATQRSGLKVLLASPRGFCAGVTRAIETVENALRHYGAPVFVRHEIVHNDHVVARLRAMGAVFIDEVGEAPDDRPLVFSAHGSPARAHAEANARGITLIDAACPLVLKVHAQVRRFIAAGRHVLIIGHSDHPEVEGVTGQAPAECFSVIEDLQDALSVAPPDVPLSYVTQTTLSVDDTRKIIDVLKKRFPAITGPRKDDICFATSNRQDAVKTLAQRVDKLFVIGSPTSSNSKRLVDVARAAGVASAMLIDDPASADLGVIKAGDVIGVTAGASAPEELVEALLTRLADAFTLFIETVETVREDVFFKTPPLAAAG
ncbi:MAG: 4-hydroxy-3-methylbut-2-enyl diphosphate reductase [Pseudomonadota bacterium]